MIKIISFKVKPLNNKLIQALKLMKKRKKNKKTNKTIKRKKKSRILIRPQKKNKFKPKLKRYRRSSFA